MATQSAQEAVGAVPVRAFDPDRDVPAAVTLFNEIEANDRVDHGISVDELRRMLTLPHHDPRQDRFIVEDPADSGRLIAHTAVWYVSGDAAAGVGLRVHPLWRRQGIGRALWARARIRAGALGAPAIEGDANQRIPAGGAFARSLGGRPVKTSVFLRCPADLSLADPHPPAGYTIRPYAVVNDVRILQAALNRGVTDHYSHHDESVAGLEQWLADPTFPHSGLFLAFGPAGEAAGFCSTQVNPDLSTRRTMATGYIDSLGVVSAHRRAGLGRALLLTGMYYLRNLGLPTIELDALGENEMALPLYESIGFRIFQQADTYRWDLA